MSARSDAAELPPLIAVVGPTASGKTALSLRLAELGDGEVISADSVQIYRYFDIGSGKATLEERRGIPHHLIDAIEPLAEVDASVFAQLATAAIDDVRRRGKRPIVCGGTFLWLKALLYGLAPAPPKDDAVRAEHLRFVELHGRAALHERLGQVDAASHQRLEPNDFVRVSRALEVYELTGTPLSEFQRGHGFSQLRYRVRFVGVAQPREVLAARIEARVREMFERGFIEEVRSLLARGYGASRAMGSVGYKQVQQALAQSAAPDLEPLVQEIAQVTRVFSRRQRTWLREQPVRWLDGSAADESTLRELLDEREPGR